jgi:hypothetical protein
VENSIPPLDIIGVLKQAEVTFLLVGTHALGGWMQEPRATPDVDILVASRSRKKAVKALTAAFPQLETAENETGTILRKRGCPKSLVDVLVANRPLLREALKHPFTVYFEGQSYLIPSLEMALAMKFSLLTSLDGGDPQIYQAAHDFILMVRVNQNIDCEKLARLGELVRSGGGPEILEKVRQVRAGEKLIL